MNMTSEMTSNSEVTIRRFTQEDIRACASIMAENSLWQRYGVSLEAAVRRFSSVDPEHDIVFIAESEGNVVGFCWFIEKGAFNRAGYIQLIGVAPDKQGRGIGEALLEAAEKISFANHREMFLTVSDFNENAREFYYRMGYEQAGALPGFVLPDITELILRKKVPG